MWLNGLSWGARFRATALTGLFVWFAFIALPATAITTVTSAVGGLQIFNAAPTQSGTPAPNIPAALTRTSSGPKSKVAYAVASETPVPTKTRIPPTATRRPPTAVPATRVPPTAAPVAAILPAATPLPAAPPVAAASIDKRLGPGGLERLQNVRIEPASGLARGQKYWHITQIAFENGPQEQTSGCGDHNIKVNVVDQNGKRIFGKKLKLTGGEPSPEYPDEKSQADAENMCGFNFSKETGGGEYTARIEDPQNPSEVAAGLQGLPMKQHVSYLITFQLTTNP